MRTKNSYFLPLLKVVKQNKGDPREILGKRGHIEPTKIPRVEVLRRKITIVLGVVWLHAKMVLHIAKTW